MRASIAIFWVIPALAQYEEVFRRVEALAENERAQKNIPSIAVALVDDQRVVWQRVFGEGKGETLFRAGSISNLLTGMAVMQQVEKKRVDLDTPVRNYLPTFQPRTSSQRRITLRLLMSHRSGLEREPPKGNNFDTTGPSLIETARSLNESDLVYDPGSHTKYSNSGMAVVGRVLEQVTGRPFREVMRENVLEPLGMRHSDFMLRPDMRPLLSKAFMWTYDGRTFPAPQFEMGMAPAAGLYTTLGDLGSFASCLFRGGEPVIRQRTLARMWEQQFGGNYGLGFVIGKMGGLRTVSHVGAIYGFATDLTVIPTDKLAAIVVVNVDSANAVATRISHQALTWMRQARQRSELEEVESTRKLSADDVERLAGRYGEGEDAIELTAIEGRLFLNPLRGGNLGELRWEGEDLVVDGRLSYGTTFHPVEGGLQSGETLLKKQPPSRPAAAPSEFRQYLGEYGWDHNVLYILERAGKLTALIEWYDYYPLTPTKPNEFRFPEWGLYDGETLTFTPEGVRVGGVLFPRRDPPPGPVFRITPLQPVADLLQKAMTVVPPQEYGTFRKPDFVEVRKLDPTIRLDIRYASKNNFLSTPVYLKPNALLQRPAAEALVRVHRALEPLGFGLMIYDAYRPWYVTRVFWDATPPDKRIFVAHPEKGSRHNRGSAVDLTLVDRKTGKTMEMPGLYDEMTERSHPTYPGGTELSRWHRDLLRKAMEKEGFRVFDVEWWHFDYKDWEQYQIANFRWDQ